MEITPLQLNLFCRETVLSLGNNGVVTVRWNSASLLIKISMDAASLFGDNNCFPPVQAVPRCCGSVSVIERMITGCYLLDMACNLTSLKPEIGLNSFFIITNTACGSASVQVLLHRWAELPRAERKMSLHRVYTLTHMCMHMDCELSHISSSWSERHWELGIRLGGVFGWILPGSFTILYLLGQRFKSW